MTNRKDLHPIFSDLDSIARQSGLIRRRSHKFSARGFLFSLLQCVTQGTSSMNYLVLQLANWEPLSMTRQALHQRFSAASSEFLVRVLTDLLSPANRPHSRSFFRRILIEDSTVISMANSNADHFPNNGNGKLATAGGKIDLVTDYLTGRAIDISLHDARDPDQTIAFDLLENIGKNDLLLRDRGYFSIDALEEIERREAFWVSRLPASIRAFDGEAVSLESLLRESSSDQVDIEIYLGRHRAHRCRLVATRLTRAETEKNRRQRRRDSKRHGATASKKGLLHDGWSLILTNLPEEDFDAKEVYRLYSIRWSIEIEFRAMKQSSHLHHAINHRSSFFHLEAMLMALMIRTVLVHDLQARLRRTVSGRIEISIEKLSDAFSVYLTRQHREPALRPFQFDPRHIRTEKRKRLSLYAATAQSLA